MTASRERRVSQIGIDRLVRLEWLEKTACLCLADNDAEAIRMVLKTDLKEHFQTDESVVRGSIDKSITVLLNVWAKPPNDLEPLCSEGIHLLKCLSQEHHIAVHWGMISAVYPFWVSVAAQVGRLLRLQGSVAAAQVQRRVREQYGERETVSRRVRYVLRSFVDWGVLKEAESRGIYGAGLSVRIDNTRLVAWLVEASLQARPGATAPLKDLITGPGLFPFRLRSIPAENLLAVHPHIDLVRHGLDDELVMLRRS
jgi:hypothetical protein